MGPLGPYLPGLIHQLTANLQLTNAQPTQSHIPSTTFPQSSLTLPAFKAYTTLRGPKANIQRTTNSAHLPSNLALHIQPSKLINLELFHGK
jgi:hypothetical protein